MKTTVELEFTDELLSKKPKENKYSHLHCKQMVPPNVSLARQNLQFSVGCDILEPESIRLLVLLPSHMQRSC